MSNPTVQCIFVSTVDSLVRIPLWWQWPIENLFSDYRVTNPPGNKGVHSLKCP